MFQDETKTAEWIDVTLAVAPTTELPTDADSAARETALTSAETVPTPAQRRHEPWGR